MKANCNTILVVEDDKAIRSLTLSALRHRGYRTLEASDGESGFAAFVMHQEDVDLVLTDVVMPVLSGPAMVEKILKVEPEARVMFMTGTPDRIEVHGLDARRYHVLPKPFTVDRLASSIERCLEGGERAER
jgi:two-component system cell cycle sensor histidine kinase/response regulator CckA